MVLLFPIDDSHVIQRTDIINTFFFITGWFYHAPAKPQAHKEPVMLPPTSQVPGLNYEIDGQYPEDLPKPLFRETDTKYVRLAKQGGRQSKLINLPFTRNASILICLNK